MSPFEALYGRRCNTLVRWDNPADRTVVGPELLKEMEDQMFKIKQNLKAACYPRYLGITRRSCLEAHMVLDMEY